MSAYDPKRTSGAQNRCRANWPQTPFRRSQIPGVIDFENRRSPKPLGWAMRRRSRASSKPTKARSREAMPKRRNATTVRAESESARLTRERDEALEREKATAEVLRVISSSAGQLEPIFQAMLENAVRICGANFGVLFLREGDAFRRTAMHNPPPAYIEEHRRAPRVRPSAASAH